MLYLHKNTNRLLIPCNLGKQGIEYTLILKGMTNTEYRYVLTDAMTSSLYFDFAVEIDIPIGTYNYTLVGENDKAVSIGLLQFEKPADEEPTVAKYHYQREMTRIYYKR